MNQVNTTAPTNDIDALIAAGKRNVYWLSNRIYQGSFEDLAAMGILFTHNRHDSYLEAILPLGWQVIDSDRSPLQRLLIDNDRVVRARLVYSGPSQSGSMEMYIEGQPTAPLTRT